MPDDQLDAVVALARQRAEELSAIAGTEYEPMYAGNVAHLLTTLAAATARLREENAALREDAARLDWLQSQTQSDIRMTAVADIDGTEEWAVADDVTWRETYFGATLRTALDRARTGGTA